MPRFRIKKFFLQLQKTKAVENLNFTHNLNTRLQLEKLVDKKTSLNPENQQVRFEIVYQEEIRCPQNLI